LPACACQSAATSVLSALPPAARRLPCPLRDMRRQPLTPQGPPAHVYRDPGPACQSLPPFHAPRKSAMLLLIDNYDSFTYNLVHFFGELGADVHVWRNDALDVQQAMALNPAGIVLSPGPCDPDRAGICLALTKAAAETGTPLLGVCLGHQTIGQAFGGIVQRHTEIVHGKTGLMHHSGESVFKGLPSPLKATRYHSLVVDRPSLPACLRVTAELEDGTIMGLAHESLPIHGVQFHPESIASEHGHAMLQTFLDLLKVPA